ncbi:TauD/TfdA dioxygenase family protein [Parahaliea aestuarii]|uniref:TauD/TfdA family dioxygenase n=1 Tax=Parahaliea aestuarii TaxID=1852021 RepID=A0A5C9A121_9GAMM|nr:TauD/TfdA family dioxygenase [Parahaliea aestuarii]TXS93297.1 TauD/TfdA family dioxygenase [Parahaliea aestuarii]
MRVTPSGQACGAEITGVDLANELDDQTTAAIRAAWLEHLVLSFPGQTLSDDDLERFTRSFGPFGEDPFVRPIPGREHIIAICRRADETSSIFAEAWHTDWSFQPLPPDGTCLYGITIPPEGGDTLFANQQLALRDMPAGLKSRIEGRIAVHSAAAGYAPKGLYGEADQGANRSMAIESSETALETQLHPLIRRHPESGVDAVYGCIGYVAGIEGMPQDEAADLLLELHAWQTRPECIYRHRWQANTLVMWDNRAVLHRATGGYQGYDRLLHRTTIGCSHGF